MHDGLIPVVFTDALKWKALLQGLYEKRKNIAESTKLRKSSRLKKQNPQPGKPASQLAGQFIG
ncbi:MAG: hypothetical protein DCF25_16325 [Leptolyngbya foveolarum]|uniref:Uncharacterized protein n=1 Tax=Leptolyngbya foveolarum TaxID=47253 RepID=A0A2W4TWM6_9CYAN|nr:MAG: hypothetical protein DCF25_16325 [Leptolyngbya foveolarum]